MFTKILIANRGEIACRVIATARRMGIRTVAVYSDADAQARHVALADEAVHIGGAAAADSYLRGDRILAACRATGAQAVHPGYGFLSENAAFAQACADAGVAWIGPPPAAIRAMGSKSEAKRLMQHSGVPLLPGYHGEDQSGAALLAEAQRLGFPLLIKAAAGGGGKGMRVVQAADEFAAALASCQREAQSSFGDAKVLIERYLAAPRHVEIQVFADSHGECVWLSERDCSVQRRHQKVLEEAPAPGLGEAVRKAMGEAAVAAAKAVGYAGAGTVEFLYDPDAHAEHARGGGFYFMEMNTRLQVEHPVTEMITGLDLVEWQLRVAAGEPLPLRQADIRLRGYAIEARLYAEDPARDFMPGTGRLDLLRLPGADRGAVAFETGDHGAGPAAVRIDAGVREGDTISPHYDPMIAKLIVWGESREAAVARLAAMLDDCHAAGPATNLALLRRLARCPDFAVAARLDTGLIARNRDSLLAPSAPPGDDALALAAVAQLAREALARAGGGSGAGPWSRGDGFTQNRDAERELAFALPGDADGDSGVVTVGLRQGRSGASLDLGGRELAFSWSGQLPALRLQCGELGFEGLAQWRGDRLALGLPGVDAALEWHNPLAVEDEAAGQGGKLSAPMPGKVIAIHVRPGQKVAQGQPLLALEAMKMEHELTAPHAGVVDELLYAVGEQVSEGAQLLTLKQE